MSLWFLTLALASWLASAALSHGLLFAQFQRGRPTFADCDYWHQLTLSLGLSLLGGCAGLPVVLRLTNAGQQGVKLW